MDTKEAKNKKKKSVHELLFERVPANEQHFSNFRHDTIPQIKVSP